MICSCLLLLLATCLQVTKVCKLCACVEGAEGTKKNCAKNLDAEPPLHDWYELEEVEEQAKITYPSPCGKCPDAKYYPKGSRPNMKKTAGNSKNCRNPDCTMYEELKSKKRKADAASPSQQTGRMQPVRLKGHAKKGMDIINERIKELAEELNGLVAVRDLLANAGAARESTEADEDDDEEEEDPAETGDGE